MAKVLVIDDFEPTLLAMQEALQNAGYEVLTARDGLGVAERVRQSPPDVLVTDILMPNEDGLALIREIRSFNKALPIIAISGGGSRVGSHYLQVAAEFGANAVLTKPFRWEELLTLLKALVR